MSYVPEDLLRLDVWEINDWLRLLTIGISVRKPSEVVELLFWDLQKERWFGESEGFCLFFRLGHCLYRAKQRDFTTSPSQERKHPQFPLSHQ